MTAIINRRVRYIYLFLIYFFVIFIGELEGTIINVGLPPASIQAAINSAVDGDTVQLSAGTYVQEFQVISKSIDIIGVGEDVTIVQSPGPLTHLTQSFTFNAINYWCIAMIDNQAAPTPHTVNISDLTVDGDNQQDTSIPPFYGNSNRFFAIGYHNANGTVQNVHTTNTKQSVSFNELAGGGILNASNNGNVTFNVTDCLVDFYQRAGIDCRGSTLTATISNNVVNRGYVLTPNTSTAAPNGIQFNLSAGGSILNNLVSENISTVSGAASSGIIIFGTPPNVVVSGNTVNDNDVGIVCINCGNNLLVSNNSLNFTITPGVNPAEGILIQEPLGVTTITSNVMDNITNVNMDLISSTDQPFNLMNNQFIGSQTGLLVVGITTDGPIVTMDSDSFTGTAGYYIQEVDAPNDIWPSTATVTFDGLLSGHMTFAEFQFVLTKIFDKHNDPALGLVLDFIPPSPPTLISINPSSGPETGGTIVTITGTNFISSNTQVFFGAILATNIIVVSDNEILATAPPGVGTVDVSVSTPFGVTPITPADLYTYLVPSNSPLPPSNFIGLLRKNKFLNRTEYILQATWDASPSPNVILYRIYNGTRLVKEVSASGPLVFVTCLRNKHSAKNYEIAAVNSNNLESNHITIEIIHE